MVTDVKTVRPRTTQGQAVITSTATLEDLEATLGIRPLIEVVEPLNIFIYGPSGVGKTVLAASVNEVLDLRPILLINVEGGTRSIKNRDGIQVVDVRTPRDIRTIRQYLREGGWRRFRTIILDSLTEFRIIESRGVLAQSVLEDATHDKEVLNLKDWGKTHDRVREFVRQLRDLPVYVLVTALAENSKDEGAGTIFVHPMLSEKLNEMIPGYFDIVAYLCVEEPSSGVPVRRLYLQPTRRIKAKDRTDALPQHIDNATMKGIMDIAQKQGLFSKVEVEETEVKEPTGEEPEEIQEGVTV